eukprot:UN09725
MFRIHKPITTLIRRGARTNIHTHTSSPALLLTSTRIAVGGTKGAPPVSIDDLYGLCFLCKPSVRPPNEIPP